VSSLKKIVNAKLATRVQQSLHEMLMEPRILESGKLPPEAELADMLGVSRTVVRDVLSDLEREGYVTRKRKSGTLINRHVLDVKIRVDQERDFQDYITSVGREYSDRLIYYRVEPAAGHLAGHLKEMFDSPQLQAFLVVAKVFMADGEPVIFCKDYLPAHLIQKPYVASDVAVAIFEFAKEFCGIELELDLTSIDAGLMDREMAEAFGAREGDPVLKLLTLGYQGQTPVMWSEQSHLPGALPLTVMRKRIWSYER